MKKLLLRNLPVLAACVLALALGGSMALALGTPAGTSITNQATVNYTDSNGNPLQSLSNVVTTVVSQVASVLVYLDRAANATPGDTIYYAHQVTNQGNGNDTIDMTAISGNGWAAALFRDNDSSGTFTPGDVLLTDTDGDTVVDTGAMAFNAVADILVRLTVPAGVASGTVDADRGPGHIQLQRGGVRHRDRHDDHQRTQPERRQVSPAGGPAASRHVLTYQVVVTNNGWAPPWAWS